LSAGTGSVLQSSSKPLEEVDIEKVRHTTYVIEQTSVIGDFQSDSRTAVMCPKGCFTIVGTFVGMLFQIPGSRPRNTGQYFANHPAKECRTVSPQTTNGSQDSAMCGNP